jgi:hypothetical protein
MGADIVRIPRASHTVGRLTLQVASTVRLV